MQTIQSLSGNEAALGISGVQAQLSFLMGKVLTIADASFSDKEQRKAAKDLIRAAFQSQANYFDELAFGNQQSAA